MKFKEETIFMQSFPNLAAVTLVAVLFSGCASVKFYSDPGLKKKTGLKYYISKPYVLLTRTGNKDNPVKLEIIQLPDLQHPNFAVYRPGWGSHQFNLKVANGILTEYGQSADSQGPQTIKAVGDLLGSAGAGFSSVLTAITAAKGPRTESAEIDAAVGSLNLAIGSLNSIANEPDLGLLEPKAAKARELSGLLTKVSDAIQKGDTDQVSVLRSISKSILNAKINQPEGGEKVVAIDNLFDLANSHLSDAIKALLKIGPTPPPIPDFELYEIRVVDEATVLIPVSISKATVATLINARAEQGK